MRDRNTGTRCGRSETLPAPVDPRDKTLSNYVARKFHELFTRVLPRGHNVRLLEVGCARSRWLPYFAAEHGYEVTGLDYSTMGCEQARQILAAAGVEGRIVEGDLFSPPEDLLEAFDVVISFGLVEHFDDTDCRHSRLSAASSFRVARSSRSSPISGDRSSPSSSGS